MTEEISTHDYFDDVPEPWHEVSWRRFCIEAFVVWLLTMSANIALSAFTMEARLVESGWYEVANHSQDRPTDDIGSAIFLAPIFTIIYGIFLIIPLLPAGVALIGAVNEDRWFLPLVSLTTIPWALLYFPTFYAAMGI